MPSPSLPFFIRTVHPECVQEIEIIAQRMRQTLIEVLGMERGAALYSMEWLIERVRFHLDPSQSTAQVFVAADGSGTLAGSSVLNIDVRGGRRNFCWQAKNGCRPSVSAGPLYFNGEMLRLEKCLESYSS